MSKRLSNRFIVRDDGTTEQVEVDLAEGANNDRAHGYGKAHPVIPATPHEESKQ